MPEFVRVTFSRVRPVNVDGAPQGQTGQLLRLQTGTHIFDLGMPVDYSPPNVRLTIRGTTRESPLLVPFSAIADIVAAAAAAPADEALADAALRTTTSARKARKQAAPKKKARAAKKRTTARRKPRPRSRAPRPAARNKRR